MTNTLPGVGPVDSRSTRWTESAFLVRQCVNARMLVEDLAGRNFQDRMRRDVFQVAGLPLESVLEAAFYIWWQALISSEGVMGRRLQLICQRVVQCDGRTYRLDFSIEPTADFAFALAQAGMEWPPVAVELDGHAFHEKTPEQVALRNQRDRDLQHAGWKVLHVSYDEMDRDGAGAFVAVSNIISSHLTSVMLEIDARGGQS